MTAPNSEMVRFWNELGGPRWAAHHQRLDAQVDALGQRMLDRLGIAAGHAVLDVGCGCGQTVLQLAERVGASGRVLGLDVSGPMLEVARRRAREAALPNVELLLGDAQTHSLPTAAFDRVCSRFGVMFFEDPVAAFKNLASALRAGGRLGFVCWRERHENDWFRVPLEAIARHIEPPPTPAPGAPGPFAFADRERLAGLLRDSGFASVEIEPLDLEVLLGGGLPLDESVAFTQYIGVIATVLDLAPSPDVRARAIEALRDALALHVDGVGVRLGAAAWIVTASR